ncbi:YcnI family protein [Pseudonocardia sp.]|uniref:YcnI family copper-binding membrane protein n=1 Tax=Pseudonocardia sp. TaxID=60912 RepID=UPI003D0F3C9A
MTAQPGTAEQGGYTVINFRVPNESDTAGTIKVEISLPLEHPITSARTTQQPGWTAVVTRSTLPSPVQRGERSFTEAVSAVTWTADPGTRIGPGEFVDFPLSVGPLPTDTDSLVFPAIQTYDDGEVVAWNEIPGPGNAEPERPAPSVTLAPAGATTAADHGQTTGSTVDAPNSDNVARWLGVGALVVALSALLGVALTRRRHAGARAEDRTPSETRS